MLDLFNIAQPQNCDIQIFYGSGTTGTTSSKSWEKPRGVSHVYMLLIGAGGAGDGSSTGGGSGAVTVWYGAAQHVPDILVVDVPTMGDVTRVGARFTASTITVLLTANNGSPITAGNATTANQFAASGFYQSIAGQNGGSGGGVTPSGTTFLAGGSDSAGASNYGYGNSGGNANGFFQLQPIIVGVGGASNGLGGIGCGSGHLNTTGSSGMVLIASW
jgi:hypothetical protein